MSELKDVFYIIKRVGELEGENKILRDQQKEILEELRNINKNLLAIGYNTTGLSDCVCQQTPYNLAHIQVGEVRK